MDPAEDPSPVTLSTLVRVPGQRWAGPCLGPHLDLGTAWNPSASIFIELLYFNLTFVSLFNHSAYLDGVEPGRRLLVNLILFLQLFLISFYSLLYLLFFYGLLFLCLLLDLIQCSCAIIWTSGSLARDIKL